MLAFALLIFVLSTQAQFRVIGYLNTWQNFPENLDTLVLDKLTHLNIAFAQPDSTGELTNFKGLDQLVETAHRHRVKVLISVGGADPGHSIAYWKLFTDSNHLSAYCQKIDRYIKQHQLDGIDIDLEGNIIGSRYESFIRGLSALLRPEHKLLTAAVANWFSGQIPGSASDYFDFINIMAYDATGPWDPAHPGPHSPISMAVSDLEFWKRKGFVKNKMNLGLPFYGYGFNGDTTAREYPYREIVSRFPGSQNSDQVGDTLFYNGAPTIREKTRLAQEKAGGVMIWELTEDAPGVASLLNVIHRIVTDK